MGREKRRNNVVKGPERTRRPLRRCLATGAVRPSTDLIRFVIDGDGSVLPDVTGRLPGRGFWLSPDRDTIMTACEKNLFTRAARTKVTTPPDLVGWLERLLTRRCLDLVGLSRRAGQLVVGYEKACAWLRSHRAGIVLAARDGAPAGRAKLCALARGVPVIDLFSAAELGAAVGRLRAVHVVMAEGTFADRFFAEAARLRGVRSGGDENETSVLAVPKAGSERERVT